MSVTSTVTYVDVSPGQMYAMRDVGSYTVLSVEPRPRGIVHVKWLFVPSCMPLARVLDEMCSITNRLTLQRIL